MQLVKRPKGGTCLASSGNSKEAGVAGGERARKHTVREVRVGWRQIFQGLVDHWEDFDFGEPLEVF